MYIYSLQKYGTICCKSIKNISALKHAHFELFKNLFIIQMDLQTRNTNVFEMKEFSKSQS